MLYRQRATGKKITMLFLSPDFDSRLNKMDAGCSVSRPFYRHN